MDYATPDKGAVTAPQKRKAKAAASKRRAIPLAITAQERCGTGSAGQPAICPAGAAAYGFLKCQFLPVIKGQLQDAGSTEEEHFYTSFEQLCGHYNIFPLATRSLGYPYSREVALWAARRLLRESRTESIQMEMVTDSNARLLLATTDTYRTGNTLYYIPVVPLYHLLKGKATKKASELLLAVCAYLLHRVGVPYYRNDDSYLYYEYEMLSEWVLEDPEGWEQDDFLHNRSQLHTADHIGDVMLRKLWNSCHLAGFAEKTAAFVPKDSFGSDCLAIARAAVSLLRDYPSESLYRYADQSVLPDQEDDCYENDCITMDKYISFCAETKGWLYYNLSECVNNEFNECSDIQEPVLRHTFDGQPQQRDSLDFEVRLFQLMDDLCYILNNTDYATH
jgi:hypothetical protein